MPISQMSGTALIVGAAGGIDQETAFTFAEAGVRAIVFADLDKEKTEEVAHKSYRHATHPEFRAIVVAVDVTSESSVQAMVDVACQILGRIDYNVNCFGVDNNSYAPISESSVKDFDNVMSINARGVMLCIGAVSSVMLQQQPTVVEGRNSARDVGRGSIVVIASANSYAPLPGKAAYVASKHAVLGIVRTAAIEMAAKGVRVNSVCPTWVATPMLDAEMEKNPAVSTLIDSMTPLKRAALPEEVAEVALFLCSSAASYVTGTGFLVDSGITLTSSLT